ncbi:hypothetical protein BCE_4581 [Bacillus cereus ATCC 10987]|uniref:Uncharacterized protein n=1 Tax=Bacillus cereus (strain ATCC 10987 / NRS 248) TaxID=222523 RepID=Q72ZT6_BACC1|nr:hypothetical protein BCE_4581 [Bacillus cereus ATCC 10987]
MDRSGKRESPIDWTCDWLDGLRRSYKKGRWRKDGEIK